MSITSRVGFLYVALLLLVLTPAISKCQAGCSGLLVNEIRYTAFNDTLLQVHVTNNSAQIFGYPGFVLLDLSGDTIARETVNFFGIAQESVHRLRIHPSATLPTSGSFPADLHLWTGFYSNFVCDLPVQVTPCPAPPCSQLAVTMGNFGGALVNDSLAWQILDVNGMPVTNGIFHLHDSVQYDADTICLNGGLHTLSIESPVFTGGQLYFGVQDLNSSYPLMLSENYQQGASSNTLDFNHFASCPGLTNSIQTADPQAGFNYWQHQGFIVVETGPGLSGALLLVHSITGSKVFEGEITSSLTRIPVNASAATYLIALENSSVRLAGKIFVPGRE